MAALQTERDALAQQVQTLTTQLDTARKTPTLVMFDLPFKISAGQMTQLGLPDTFTVRIAFTASTPVRARIMSLEQYVRYVNTGTTDALTYPAATSLDVIFHDAEGCAGYVLVLDAAKDAVITPNVTITRVLPGRGYTGVCAP